MASISYKCPNCDGELMFDPATQKYKCPYCASLFSQQQICAMRPDTAGAGQTSASVQASGSHYGEATGQGEGSAVQYNCPSCGAQIVTEETTAATFCYYCHNPVILGGKLEGRFLPDQVIPFEITRENTVQGFLQYVRKKKFVPKAFWNKRQIEKISGVYFPYWVYDVELNGRVLADARKTRSWRSGNTQYTETKIYSVRREGDIALSNLPENALMKAGNVLAQGVLPYRYEKAKEFHMSYLSGFLAERRDIERSRVQDKMRQTMQQSAQQMMRETITGYNSVNIGSASFQPVYELWKYVLFPVWTITYKGRNGKMYYYSMNGQTGKVIGELPIDYKKVTLASVLAAAVVLALGLAVGYIL